MIAVKGVASNRIESGLKAMQAKYGKPTQLKIESFFSLPIKRPPPVVRKYPKKKGNFCFYKPFGEE